MMDCKKTPPAIIKAVARMNRSRCAMVRLLCIVMVLTVAINVDAAKEPDGSLITPPAAQELLQSIADTAEDQRAELEAIRAQLAQLEEQRVQLLSELSSDDVLNADDRSLLLGASPPIDSLEMAIRRNRTTAKAIATSLETLQARYQSAVLLAKQTDNQIELAEKQLASFRSGGYSRDEKQQLSTDTKQLIGILNDKRSEVAKVVALSEPLRDQMKKALSVKDELLEDLSARLNEIRKASLFVRNDHYQSVDADTVQAAVEEMATHIRAVADPETWQALGRSLKTSGLSPWVIFVSVIGFVVMLQGRGRRFLQRMEEAADRPGWHYRRVGIHMLRRSTFLIAMTAVFGIYDHYQVSILPSSVKAFLFKFFFVLLLIRWSIDFLNHVPIRRITGARALITGRLKRLIRFLGGSAVLIVILSLIAGRDSVILWLVRDLATVIVLVWAFLLVRRFNRVVLTGETADTRSGVQRRIGTIQWGIFIFAGGSLVFSLAGYGSLSRHWGLASAETMAILLLGWVVVQAVKEWRADVDARLAAAAAEQESDAPEDVRGAFIRLARLVCLIAVITGIVTAWDYSGELFSGLGVIVGQKINIGSLTLSIKGVVSAVLVLFFTRFSVQIGKAILVSKILANQTLDQGLKDSIATIFSYLGWAVGLLLALGILGVDGTSLAVVFGALSIGIGFGLQNIFNNFISGLILLFERPIQVGDYIEVGGLWATVKKINVRATQVQTFDNASVIIPNSELISQQVTNWSYKDKRMRRSIEIGVAYGSDIDLVIGTLKDIVKNTRNVLKHPKPDVIFTDHADSALVFRLRIWVHVDYYWEVPSEIRYQIDKRFRENNIEIAFPQRDLHLRSIPKELTEIKIENSDTRGEEDNLGIS
jgi:potassium efflux system protein